MGKVVSAVAKMEAMWWLALGGSRLGKVAWWWRNGMQAMKVVTLLGGRQRGRQRVMVLGGDDDGSVAWLCDEGTRPWHPRD
ncbi:hypothetical protein Dimus_011188 [Dionaea muscipula]